MWRAFMNSCPEDAEYGDLYASRSTGTVLVMKDSKMERIACDRDESASLRWRLKGGLRTLMAASNGWDADYLAALMRKKAKKGRGKKGKGLFFERQKIDLSPFYHPCQKPPSEVPLEEKAALLRRMDEAVRCVTGSRVRQVSLVFSDSDKTVLQITSEGRAIEERWNYISFSVHVIVEEGSNRASAYESFAAVGGWESLGLPLDLAKTAALRALSKLEARPAPAGKFPVVIASSAGGTFVHEAIGHSLEADAVQDGVSPLYRARMGKKVAAPFVSIVDDPTLQGRYGSYHYDDEGVEAAPVRLVDKGVLSAYLYDRLRAVRDRKKSNGHGRRESPFFQPIPRMSNIYIEPGTENPRNLIRSLEKGMLVTKMGGGEVNTATGEFMFEVEEGFWVEQGKVRHMVRDANLCGVGTEALASITRVANDLGWSTGICGKDGQSVPVSDGLPTILISNLLIGGESRCDPVPSS